jgi:3-phenylpropionate/trans-cinnamate dioxygenase ferredoxin subunit
VTEEDTDATTHRGVARLVCRLDDLKDGDVTAVAAGMTPLCIARDGDRVWALVDACTHEGVKLSDGWFDAGTRTVECWRHSSCFSLGTGEPDGPPAERPVPVFPAWIDGDEVFVRL